MDRVGGLNVLVIGIMNLGDLKETFGKLSPHDLSAGAAALVGLVLLFLILKTGKFLMKLVLFLIAVGLLVGAYWWHTHQ